MASSKIFRITASMLLAILIGSLGPTLAAGQERIDICQWKRFPWPAAMTPLVQARPCRLKDRAGLCLLSKHTAGFASVVDGRIVIFGSGFSGEGKDIAYDSINRRLWVLSTTGLWVFDEKSWRHVWNPRDEIRRFNRLGLIDKAVWVGTDKGLWVKQNNKANLDPLSGPWRDEVIYDFARTAEGLWILTEGALYLKRLILKTQPEVVFRLPTLSVGEDNSVADDHETGPAASGDGESTQGPQPQLFIETDDQGRWTLLAIASQDGIFISRKNGGRFLQFPLWTRGERISAMLDQQTLILAMGSSFWMWRGNDATLWRRLSPGPALVETVSLVSAADRIVAVGPFDYWKTGRSCVLNAIGGFSNPNASVSCPNGDFQGPSLRLVQQWVIEEADVSQEKIRRWRASARHRAWLPSFNVSVDRNIGDLWHWDSGQSPDVLLKGQDAVEWSVGLSWDLGDVVFNDDLIDIETRSRLMVQLRQDLLDRAVRYYIEYKRLWAQWRQACSNSSESNKLSELLLSLEETVGFLDALTGGRFSEGLAASKARD